MKKIARKNKTKNVIITLMEMHKKSKRHFDLFILLEVFLSICLNKKLLIFLDYLRRTWIYCFKEEQQKSGKQSFTLFIETVAIVWCYLSLFFIEMTHNSWNNYRGLGKIHKGFDNVILLQNLCKDINFKDNR